MRLLVDIGNSRMKSAVEMDGEVRALQTFAWRDVFLHDVLAQVWLESLPVIKPTSIHVSNVAGDGLLPNLNAWCCQHWGLSPVPIRSAAAFDGLVNGYLEPTSLGVDRWAAMIGARALYRGALCVVDSGSATTVDVIRADGQHIGGAILPGIYTMRRSLGKYTNALFAADGDIAPFSDNTAGGIAGGTGYASVGAIDRLILESVRAVGELTTVVTGGDASIQKSLMQSPARHEPLLVLKGVSVIADALSADEQAVAARCPDSAVFDSPSG